MNVVLAGNLKAIYDIYIISYLYYFLIIMQHCDSINKTWLKFCVSFPILFYLNFGYVAFGSLEKLICQITMIWQ